MGSAHSRKRAGARGARGGGLSHKEEERRRGREKGA